MSQILHNVNDSFFFLPILPNDIEDTIVYLKNNKSFGNDGISSSLVKALSTVISSPLSSLFNRCIQSGYFPAELKNSIVIPLYKGGSHNQLNNYRLISQTSTIAKIFEKVIKLQLNNYLDRYKIIDDKQYGFRKNKCTQDALTNLISEVNGNLD